MPPHPDPGDPPANDTPQNGGPTAAQVRRDIDAGRTRDKVAAEDPAAAPLGTDDEASGHPVTPRQARMAEEAEERPLPPPPSRRRARQGVLTLVVLVALVALIVLAWWGGAGG